MSYICRSIHAGLNQIIELRAGSFISGVVTIDADPREQTVWDANYNIVVLPADQAKTVERYGWTTYGGTPQAMNGSLQNRKANHV